MASVDKSIGALTSVLLLNPANDDYSGLATTEEGMVGDINCDGVVNLLDVGPFVDLVSDGGYSLKADFDLDGIVSLLDVGPFVESLTGF